MRPLASAQLAETGRRRSAGRARRDQRCNGIQAAWRYWRNVPGFAAVNEIGRRPPSRFILSHAVWSRSMRGNSCGISNGASLMSASFCCRCCSPTDVSANNRAGQKFNVDQVVDYAPKGASKFSVPRGAYKITKLLPEETAICA